MFLRIGSFMSSSAATGEGATGVSLPSGAIGVYYASQFDSATNAIPNSAAASSTIRPNLLRAPRRLFSTNNSSFWGGIGVTFTEGAGTTSDGNTDATRVLGTGGWYVFPNPGSAGTGSKTLPAGTYTAAIDVKSNTGGTQAFALSSDNAGTRNVKTATTSWQTFTITFTKGASWNPQTMILCSSDGSTGADILIADFELFSGSSAPAATPLAGHLYLGWMQGDDRRGIGTGYVDLSATAYGSIQFASATTFTAGTFIAIASKVVSGTGSGYQGFLSKIQNYLDLTAAFEIAGKPTHYFKSSNSLDQQGSGLWEPYTQGYLAYTCRHNGTHNDIFINGARVSRQAGTPTSFTASDYFVGAVGHLGLLSNQRIAAMAIYSRALSDAEVRQAVAALASQVAASSISLASERIYIAEGDSITGAQSYCYPFVFGPNASPKMMGVDQAITGSTLANLNSRATALDAGLPADVLTSGKKYILSVLIGVNDLSAYTGGAAQYITDLKAYCSARKAAGWKVVVCTILPKNDATHNSRRATVNADIVDNWVSGGFCDAVANLGGDATYGQDADAANAAKYPDGTHPVAAAHTQFETIIRTAINAL